MPLGRCEPIPTRDAAGTTAICFGGGQATTQASYLTEITKVAANLPSPSTQSMSCGGVEYAGAWYHSADGVTGVVVYFLKGSPDCTKLAGLIFTTGQ